MEKIGSCICLALLSHSLATRSQVGEKSVGVQKDGMEKTETLINQYFKAGGRESLAPRDW